MKGECKFGCEVSEDGKTFVPVICITMNEDDGTEAVVTFRADISTESFEAAKEMAHLLYRIVCTGKKTGLKASGAIFHEHSTTIN